MRKRKFVLWRMTIGNRYHISIDSKTPFYELEKLPHYINCYTSYAAAFEAAKKTIDYRIKEHLDNLNDLIRSIPNE